MYDDRDNALDVIDQNLGFEGGYVQAFELFVNLKGSKPGIGGFQEGKDVPLS